MDKGEHKVIRVVAAVIRRKDISGNVSILATQRGYGDMKGGWEFPGGKIEKGEDPQDALVREIKEELNASIEVGSLIDTVEYDYPSFHLSMDCFWCDLNSDIELKEHSDGRWLKADELMDVNWLPADISLVQVIKQAIS